MGPSTACYRLVTPLVVLAIQPFVARSHGTDVHAIFAWAWAYLHCARPTSSPSRLSSSRRPRPHTSRRAGEMEEIRARSWPGSLSAGGAVPSLTVLVAAAVAWADAGANRERALGLEAPYQRGTLSFSPGAGSAGRQRRQRWT
ncbi:hypothetical protein DFH09DRAFT_391501 [Mycena vulgaris]|nr:hypothetical protein DFH09DRAFT_391501 [Mycena vulgaris]